MTKTTKRRREGRTSEGLHRLLCEIPVDHSIALSVRRKLAGIVAKLAPLSEQHGITEFLKNADRAEIMNGIVQDLAYAVTDYQV